MPTKETTKRTTEMARKIRDVLGALFLRSTANVSPKSSQLPCILISNIYE